MSVLEATTLQVVLALIAGILGVIIELRRSSPVKRSDLDRTDGRVSTLEMMFGHTNDQYVEVLARVAKLEASAAPAHAAAEEVKP